MGVPLRYTGQRLDPDSGLYYYKSRWYSPYLGRFLSPDPTFVSDGLHLYAYVGNDPVNYTDPSGNWRQAGRTIWRNGGRTLADWTPVLGDGLAIRYAWNHPTALSIAAAGVPDCERGNIHDTYEIAGDTLKLRVHPEQLLIEPDPRIC
jgi:RHS repeat-associated protein